MELPEAFIKQSDALLGEESTAFYAALKQPPPISVRINRRKQAPVLDVKGAVPWCREGMYLKERPRFTLDPNFHAGSYYVQESSSMIIGWVVAQIFGSTAPILALDMCGAPGGKSTLLSDAIPEGSFLVANEVIKSRYRILEENLSKWGLTNVAITNLDSKQFSPSKGHYDLVLVDAPCSGEGLFRKDAKAIGEWSPQNVELCSARQKRILANAIPLLGDGGVLIYSTCTYNEQENDQNIEWLLKNFELEPITPEVPETWNIARTKFGCQFYPHRTDSEGLFFCCLRSKSSLTKTSLKRSSNRHFLKLAKKYWPKINPWLDQPKKWYFYQNAKGRIFALHKEWHQEATQFASIWQPAKIGIDIGVLKNEDFIPSPQLALSQICNQQLPRVDLEKEEALQYLKKAAIDPTRVPKGWAIATYRQNQLGWMKGLGTRVNNYYPKEWRIRMDINR